MQFDVIVVGAGAAGMMCAIEAGKRGRKVLLLDHSRTAGEKIRISGGGRCNFTNLHTRPDNFLSNNPHFCRSALARYTPRDFIAMVDSHGIAWHEKKLGQLFCDASSEQIIRMLENECGDAGVQSCLPTTISNVSRQDRAFILASDRGEFTAHALVIASGGLSIPKVGASPFGYQIAEQFGLSVTPLRPALVGLTFAPDTLKQFAELSGISIDAGVACGGAQFRENILITHRGLSGPSILQISSYWQHGMQLSIDLLPDQNAGHILDAHKASDRLLANVLAEFLPQRFALRWVDTNFENKPLKQFSEAGRRSVAALLHDWRVQPSGAVGYRKAEVTLGGVDTRQLSSKTMEAVAVPGLYFIGEVVDVTGHLGGFNFQWAWASGFAAGQHV